jgi:hypothetical protein
MRRYIDADKLQEEFKELHGGKRSLLIDTQPTADVVEVVRCKDCKHRPIDTQEEGNGFDFEFPEEYGCPGYCDDGYYSNRFNDDFYCAWGERADT